MFIVLLLLVQSLDTEAHNSNPTRPGGVRKIKGQARRTNPGTGERDTEFKAGLGSMRPCSNGVGVGKRTVQLLLGTFFNQKD